MTAIYSRRVSFTIDLDLAKGSKEAHAVTVERIARRILRETEQVMIDKGYKVQGATITTLLHTVRHKTIYSLPHLLAKRAKATALKKVG